LETSSRSGKLVDEKTARKYTWCVGVHWYKSLQAWNNGQKQL